MSGAESDHPESRGGFCYGNLEKALERGTKDLWKAVALEAVEFS